ncbi:hypothetical protein FXW78_46245 [Rhodococcus opacus]|nr:hypothetical protein [Rhodococcus opacus]
MRRVFAHQAVVDMAADADVDVLGAAVTSALCTHWGDQRPRSLAPHRTSAVRGEDGRVRIRVLFAADSATEYAVRCRIELALAGGHMCGLNGTLTRWELRSSAPADPTADEAGQVTGFFHGVG